MSKRIKDKKLANGTSGSKDLQAFKKSGRIRPFVLALIILVAGLLLEKWWWQVGVAIMIVLFVEAFYRYRRLS